MKKSAKKLLSIVSIVVVMVLSMSIFQVSASAYTLRSDGNTFYEIQNVNSAGAFGQSFPVPTGYNLMTVSARAVNLGGASTVNISLINGSNGVWSNYSIPADGNYYQLFTRKSVVSNGWYQFYYRPNAGSAQVIIGGAYDR